MQELSFIYAVSSAVASSLDAQRKAERIADLATEVPGIQSIQFDGLDIEAGDTGSPAIAVASAEIAAKGRRFGEVHIRFDLGKTTVESPVRLARFIGRQLGLVLAGAETAAANEALERELARMDEDLSTRKVFHRARGILARDLGVTEQHAGNMLRVHSRRTGRPLGQIAEAVVTASGVEATLGIRKSA